MNFEEILKKTSEEIDEILALKKSYDEGQMMAKEKPATPPASDGQGDMIQEADEGVSEADDVASYAQQLSDEELYSLLSSLSEEAEARGIGEDQAPESAEQAPGLEASPEGEAQADAAMAPPPAEGGEAPPAEGGEAPPAEGGEGMDGAEGSIEGKIAGLADEELSMLMSAVQAELEMRQGGQEGGEQAPAGEPNLQQSMEKSKEDFTQTGGGATKEVQQKPGAKAKPARVNPFDKIREEQKQEAAKETSSLEKSISDLTRLVTTLSSKITTLEKSVKPVVAAKTEVPASTYASGKVKVLEKSQSGAPETLLDGPELQNWLLTEQRGKNKKVKSDYVVSAGLMKSEEEVAGFYAEMQKLGLNPPKK